MSVSYDQRVESVLSILNMTVEDAGKYTCLVNGDSSAVTLTVLSAGKLKSNLSKKKLYVSKPLNICHLLS